MSQPDFISRWAERASDRLNPILVKETRQALKSRQFLATFSIMLFGGWLISAFVLLSVGVGQHNTPVGGTWFPFYYSLLALTVMLVVPFGAYRSLLAERDLNTYELLDITTLSTQQIVWGKWLSSQVQTFIYFSSVSPFIAFTYLLRGVDFPSLIFILLATMFASMLLSLLSLTISTFAKVRQTQVVLSLGLLGGLVWAMITSIRLSSQWVGQSFIDFSDLAGNQEFFWTLIVIATYYAAVFVLCLQIARAQLTFESDNRSTGIRIVCSAMFWLTIGWLGLGVYYSTPGRRIVDDGVFISVISTVGIYWAVVSMYAATELDPLSRRIRGKLFRRRLLRFLSVPFLPGGGRGMIYVSMHLAALFALIVAASVYTPQSFLRVVEFTCGLACYLVIFAGLSSATGRWIYKASPAFRPGQIRAVMIVFFAVAWLAPNIAPILLEKIRTIRSPFFFLTDPVHTFGIISTGGPKSTQLLTVLAVAAALVLLLNVRAMWRGMSEVVFPRSADENGLDALEQSQRVLAESSAGGALDAAVTSEAPASG